MDLVAKTNNELAIAKPQVDKKDFVLFLDNLNLLKANPLKDLSNEEGLMRVSALYNLIFFTEKGEVDTSITKEIFKRAILRIAKHSTFYPAPAEILETIQKIKNEEFLIRESERIREESKPARPLTKEEQVKVEKMLDGLKKTFSKYELPEKNKLNPLQKHLKLYSERVAK